MPIDSFESTVPRLQSDVARHNNRDNPTSQYETSPMNQVSFRGERGTIVDSDAKTNTYTVSSERNGASGADIPNVGRMVQSLSDNRMLPNGTPVAITRDYGYPLIIGVLPFTTGKSQVNKNVRITGESGVGGEDPLGGRGEVNFRNPNAPVDLGPNDYAEVGALGNFISVLEGGVSAMGASQSCQVRTHLLKDLLEIISRNYRHVTDMGISEIKNENGRISWSFRGGADQLTEAGNDEENWSVRIDLGASGDLFNFELTRPDGTSLFRFHVNNDGKVEIFGAKGVDTFGGDTNTEKHLQGRQTVVKRKDQIHIGGDQEETIEGNKTKVTSGSMTETVGNDRTISAVRNETRTVGGIQEEKIVGGNAALMKPGDVAKETTVNATWKVSIGDPLAGSNPVALPSFDMEVFSGDIKQNITTKGDIEQTTKLGNITNDTIKGDILYNTMLGAARLNGKDVILGGSGGDEPMVLGNMWVDVMGRLIDAITQITVPTAVGPSGPPINTPALVALKTEIAAKTQLSTYIKGSKIWIPG